MKFTARTVARIKPTKKRTEYFDRAVPGLALRVTPTGTKSWTLYYRHRGRQRRLTLGSADAISLAKARSRARDELTAASAGADPATEKQVGRKAETMTDLADLFIARYAKKKKRSWKADDNLLRRRVLPKWRHRAIADITRDDVLKLVEDIADAGAPIVANHVVSLLSTIFNFALNQGRPHLVVKLNFNPAARIPKPGKSKRGTRALSESEIRTFWTATATFAPPMAAFYRLLLLTAQRPHEVTNMRWQDIDFETAWWTIPDTDAKNGIEQHVPLSAMALTILAERLADAHKDAVYVLEAHARRDGAGARGRRQQYEAAATLPLDKFTPYVLRRTATSTMTRGRVPRLWVDKLLNHKDRGVIAHYDVWTYDAEKVEVIDWWDAKLRAILDNASAKVLPFARGA